MISTYNANSNGAEPEWVARNVPKAESSGGVAATVMVVDLHLVQ